MSQQVIVERGGMARLSEIVREAGIRRPMLVCSDRRVDEISLPGAVIMSAFHSNPDFQDCVRAYSRFREENCDGVVAVGGGSAMDTAKCVLAISDADDVNEVLFSKLRGGPQPPFVAVPTTAGTGSEATPTAVIYSGITKYSVANDNLIPCTVLLDAELLRTLPDYHRKACALDAFCQGVESFWARAATEESREHARRAFLGVMHSLPAYLAGDEDAAEAMLIAAYESGRAISFTRTTAPHAMSYLITKLLGCAHGHACAITLPAVWQRLNTMPDMRDTMNALASSMGVSTEDALRIARGMIASLSLPTPWEPAPEILETLVLGVNLQRLGNHPQLLTADGLREIYIEALTKPEPKEEANCVALWEDWHG